MQLIGRSTRVPTVAVIMLHPLCNMSCSFCISEDSMGTFTSPQAVCLLDRLKGENFKSTVFGGGEPLAWRHDTIAMTREAKHRGFLVQVGTNGILLRAGFAQIDSVDRWVLPIDGADASVHNAMRFWGNRHFEVILDRLHALRSAGKSTTLSTVVTRVNQREIPRIASLLHELNSPRPFIHAWHLYQFIPHGRGGEQNRDRLQLSATEYDEICNPIKTQDLGFTVFRRPDMLRSQTVEFFSVRNGKLQRQLGDRVRFEAN